MCDLPFQWDDGNFVSPFVAASEEDMEALAEWISENYLSPVMQSCSVASCSSTGQLSAASRSNELRLTDLGCGDATAVLSLARHIGKGWCGLLGSTTGASPPHDGASLHITVTGIDLDDALLETARENASVYTATSSSLLPPSSVSVQTQFVAQDLRAVDVEAYFPRWKQGSGVSSCVPPLPPYVLYMYLLPEALLQIRENLLSIMERGWLVASNRWPIPEFENFLRGRAGHVHIYCYAHP